MNFHNIPSSRLENIGEFLRTAQTYETLGLSRIEGIENFHARCQLLLTNLKKKPYNPLEHRKQDFDVDYQDFKTQLKEFEVREHLTGTINSCEYCYWVFTLHRFSCKHTWTSTLSRQRRCRGRLSSLSALKGMQSTLVAASDWTFLHHYILYLCFLQIAIAVSRHFVQVEICSEPVCQGHAVCAE